MSTTTPEERRKRARNKRKAQARKPLPPIVNPNTPKRRAKTNKALRGMRSATIAMRPRKAGAQ